MQSLIKCRAKDPYECKYHGFPTLMSGNHTAENVSGTIIKNLVHKNITKSTAAKKLLDLYRSETFLSEKSYLSLIENAYDGKEFSDNNFEAESKAQLEKFEATDKFDIKTITSAFKTMTLEDGWNSLIREDEEHVLIDRMLSVLDHAYSLVPKRAFSNRLFRGVAFENKQAFASWVSSNSITYNGATPAIKNKEYFRTSTNLYRAYSFAGDSNYPVIFEVLSKDGVYLNGQLSRAPQEREVLLNRNTSFNIVGITENVEVKENGTTNFITVVKLENL